MLNKFCFHVYAQKSLFRGENYIGSFLTSEATPMPPTLLFVSITINHLAELLFTGDWERSSRRIAVTVTQLVDSQILSLILVPDSQSLSRKSFTKLDV